MNVSQEVRKWVLSGCCWKNNAFYCDPVEAITRGDRVKSYEYVFSDVLDCVFARGEYTHLRPIGRYKQSHSDASFSRYIYSPVSTDNIPLHIVTKYPSTPQGRDLANNEWEYERKRRGSELSSNEVHITDTTSSLKHEIKPCVVQDVDSNLNIRESAFSFIQVWLSQVVHDFDQESERYALRIFRSVVKLSRYNQNVNIFFQSIRNLIEIPPSATTANADTVFKITLVLLIARDIVQDLRYNWGCQDLHRLRLPIRYAISDGNMWENVFFPVIIESLPSSNFSRGSLAGIVVLSEVLAYHVIEPNNDLATVLCTELVKRVSAHSLGYETALRAVRAALTRWAFEQDRNQSTMSIMHSRPKYNHGIDEPKEIVLPLLVRMRNSLIQDSSFMTHSCHLKSNQPINSRKRRRCCYDMDDDLEEDEETVHSRKCLRIDDDRDRSDPLFSDKSLSVAKKDANEVISGAEVLSKEDKIEMLNQCISIVERVIAKRIADADRDKNEVEDDANEMDGYVDLVSEILDDLRCLDLADRLKKTDIVAAALEKTCTHLNSVELS